MPFSRRLAAFVSPKRIMWRREETKAHGMRLLACVFYFKQPQIDKISCSRGSRHQALRFN